MNRAHTLSLAALAVIALSAQSCSRAGSTPAPGDAPISVRVAPVAVESLALPVTGTGTLASKDGVNLSFKLGGVVARVLVDEGVRVRRGQLLASLELGEIDPGVARAGAAAEKAERDFQRAQRLYADSVATLTQVQDARTARDAAGAEYDAVRFNRSHAVIVAPTDGVVLRRMAEPGQVVEVGTPVLAFGSHARSPVVRVGLADRDLVRVRLGDAATVRFDAIPDRPFTGTVSEVGASADPATGTFAIEVTLPGAISLADGLVGNVEIHPHGASPVSLVPIESLLEANGDAATVYTIAPDGRRAERRDVRIGFMAGNRVAVRSGLEGARVVVVEGADRLDAGARVEVVR